MCTPCVCTSKHAPLYTSWLTSVGTFAWTVQHVPLYELGAHGLPRLRESLLSQDSYLIDYFLFLNRYFEVGPPVYFVTTSGYNFSSQAGMNAICSSAGCDSFSLTQKIQYATEFPEE